MNGFFSASSKGGHAESLWPASGGLDRPAAVTWFGAAAGSGAASHGDAPWAAAVWRESSLSGHEPHDAAAESGADRMVEACAMWIFMGAMVCAIVSLGILVLPLVIIS